MVCVFKPVSPLALLFIPLSHSPISLLYRYSLLYSSGSCVGILKVSHTRRKATFGLKAIRAIPAGTFIMETCSSMSLDLASTQGPSIIDAAPNQLGPPGPRLILGPFRLVNHDCKPNAQVRVFLPLSACSNLCHADLPGPWHLCLCYGRHKTHRNQRGDYGQISAEWILRSGLSLSFMHWGGHERLVGVETKCARGA